MVNAVSIWNRMPEAQAQLDFVKDNYFKARYKEL